MNKTHDEKVLEYLDRANEILKSQWMEWTPEDFEYLDYEIEIAKMIQAQEIADDRAEYERA